VAADYAVKTGNDKVGTQALRSKAIDEILKRQPPP
jgi:hypothetical protein